MPDENKKIDINKHEVDIDTLFKQNVNDLISIKELYSKLKEMDDKISQIKYVDSTLAKKLKREYESLKRVILDENVQTELTNNINNINTKLDNAVTKLNNTEYKRFNVRDYGAKGDGITDDSKAIRRCIADLPQSNFELIFPAGVYIQGDGTNPHYTKSSKGFYSGDVNIGTPIYFDFTNKSDFKIIGYGAEIQAHQNNSCIANNRGFSFTNCNNIYIEGLKYNGNKNSRQPWGGDGSGYNLQSAFLFTNCNNINLINVIAVNSVMDGFTFRGSDDGADTYCKYINMTNCKAINGYRQGVSAINSHYGVLCSCEFSETGKDFGTAPMFGVDLEQGNENYPDRGQKNWSIRDCLFKDNVGQGLGLHWGSYNTLVESNTFINNAIYCPKDSEFLTINNTIRNNVFYDAPNFEMQGGGALVENNVFYATEYCKIFITDVNKGYENGKCRKNVFRNNTIISDLSNVDYTNKEIKTMNQAFFTDVTDIIDNNFINMYFVKEENKTGYCLNLNGISELSKFEGNRFIYNVNISSAVSSISLPNYINRNNNEYDSTFNISYRRPAYTSLTKKAMIFDETLNKPLWWDGTKWIDGTGTTIS